MPHWKTRNKHITQCNRDNLQTDIEYTCLTLVVELKSRKGVCSIGSPYHVHVYVLVADVTELFIYMIVQFVWTIVLKLHLHIGSITKDATGISHAQKPAPCLVPSPSCFVCVHDVLYACTCVMLSCMCM